MYILFKDKTGDWRWRLEAGNHKIVATSGEGYRNREDCVAGLRIMQNSADMIVFDMESGKVVSP